MKRFFQLLGCVLFLGSCEETIILDTEQVEPQLVINLHLTSNNSYQYAVVSQSVDFYDDTQPPIVANAEVSVTDMTVGEVYEFQFAPDEDKYFSDVPFAGIPGHEYLMEVVYDGETYTARERMLEVTPIIRISYELDISEQNNPSKEGYHFVTTISAKEPQDTEDYYLFKFYRNDSITYAGSTDIYFTDDKLLGENIEGVASPVYYSSGDIARVEMYSITREAYVYLNDLFNVMNNDSGMFSPPPANPRGNISNGALGYFMVSDVSSKSIEIP